MQVRACVRPPLVLPLGPLRYARTNAFIRSFTSLHGRLVCTRAAGSCSADATFADAAPAATLGLLEIIGSAVARGAACAVCYGVTGGASRSLAAHHQRLTIVCSQRHDPASCDFTAFATWIQVRLFQTAIFSSILASRVTTQVVLGPQARLQTGATFLLSFVFAEGRR